jgi:DnaJ-like protein
LQDYYQLLDIASTATADEVKRAFRQQIARYHPDKVHHLGKEFQDIAATRAAELTEAYRVLSDAGRRAEYDKTRGATSRAPAAAPPPSTPSNDATIPPRAQFDEERATRDRFLRRAVLDRFRDAFAHVAAGFDEAKVRGFDIAWLPKPHRSGGSRLRVVGRLVSRVDSAAVADAWNYAAKWNVPAGDEICVILMGTAVAPERELAGAIASQRKLPTRGARITLIPVDMSVWNALIPTDAPPVARALLSRIRQMN